MVTVIHVHMRAGGCAFLIDFYPDLDRSDKPPPAVHGAAAL